MHVGSSPTRSSAPKRTNWMVASIRWPASACARASTVPTPDALSFAPGEGAFVSMWAPRMRVSDVRPAFGRDDVAARPPVRQEELLDGRLVAHLLELTGDVGCGLCFGRRTGLANPDAIGEIADVGEGGGRREARPHLRRARGRTGCPSTGDAGGRDRFRRETLLGGGRIESCLRCHVTIGHLGLAAAPGSSSPGETSAAFTPPQPPSTSTTSRSSATVIAREAATARFPFTANPRSPRCGSFGSRPSTVVLRPAGT